MLIMVSEMDFKEAEAEFRNKKYITIIAAFTYTRLFKGNNDICYCYKYYYCCNGWRYIYMYICTQWGLLLELKCKNAAEIFLHADLPTY